MKKPDPLKVSCAWCWAAPKEPCTNSYRKPMKRYHACRVLAAKWAPREPK